jgi:DivIVA domain-containing protein
MGSETRGNDHDTSAGERGTMVHSARDVEFPIAMRGYERAAVDRYVQQVNRLIAELEMSASPESAVRHALEEVSEETRDLLQRAHQTAEDITARSRSRADERLQEAENEAVAVRDAAAREAGEKRETAERETAELRETVERETGELLDKARRDAEELRTTALRETEELRRTSQRDAEQMRETAETYARELYRNSEFLWRERRRLVEDMGSVGKQMVDMAEAEARRFERLPGGADRPTPPGESVPEQELAAAAGSVATPSEEPDQT